MNIDTMRIVGLMPHVKEYHAKLNKLGQWWQLVTMVGKINSREIAATLIDDMDRTRHKLEELQGYLIQNIVSQNQHKLNIELSAIAQVAIDILIRNLFERTADVGFLATDDDIRTFLQLDEQLNIDNARADIINRLHEYTLKYSVYDEIIILSPDGQVKVHLDQNNPINQSFDALIDETINSGEPYIETFRYSDLQPNLKQALIYSAPIKQSDNPGARLLGVLCLCFRFDDEMAGIFSDLQKGDEVIAILDNKHTVIASNDHEKLAIGSIPPIVQNGQVEMVRSQQQTVFSISVKNSGYQGFYGLSWQGYVMLSGQSAFSPSEQTQAYDESLFNSDYFSEQLKDINHTANIIIDDLILVVINGQIISAKRDAKEFMPVLTEIRSIGTQTKQVFDQSIHNLYSTVLSSLLSEVQFQAALAVDIMDRNLYERANDVRWWALTTKFRELMEKAHLDEQDVEALSSILTYINNLYTVYTNLFIYDLNGKIIAVSNPAETNQVGQLLSLDSHFKAAIQLSDSQSYVVSPFEVTDLYAQQHTYIYLKSIMGRKSGKPVGGIGIVFDSEPEFLSMLNDALPRNEKGEIIKGAFAIFCGQNRQIISSTHPDYLVGEQLALDATFFALEQGRRTSRISTVDGQRYAIGASMSKGYREYKTTGDYQNNVLALIFMPI